MLSMRLSKRFVQQIVLDGFAFVGIHNNLLDCYKIIRFFLLLLQLQTANCNLLESKKVPHASRT